MAQKPGTGFNSWSWVGELEGIRFDGAPSMCQVVQMHHQSSFSQQSRRWAFHFPEEQIEVRRVEVVCCDCVHLGIRNTD